MRGMRADGAVSLQAEQAGNGKMKKRKRKEEKEKSRIRQCA